MRPRRRRHRSVADGYQQPVREKHAAVQAGRRQDGRGIMSLYRAGPRSHPGFRDLPCGSGAARTPVMCKKRVEIIETGTQIKDG